MAVTVNRESTNFGRHDPVLELGRVSKGHSHSHSSAHYGNRDAVRAVTVSAVALGIAATAEIAASVLSGSASVLADGLHNAGDVLTSFILLFTFALVRRPATRRFSSGYGRFEDVATLLIIVVIIVTAAVAAACLSRRSNRTS